MKEWEDMNHLEKMAIKYVSERSFLDFTQIWFEMLQGEKMLVNWHHMMAAQKADDLISGKLDGKSLIINFPPGGTKTEFFSVHMPAYTNTLVNIGYLDKFRNLNLSFASSLVKENSRRTKGVLSSVEYQELWPCNFGLNQAEAWEIVDSKGKVKGKTESVTPTGQVTGKRGGYKTGKFSGMICLDDPDKPTDMFSQTKRESMHRTLTNTIRSRRGDKSKHTPTPFLVVQQRLHVDDTTGFFLQGKMGVECELLKIPALVSEDFIEQLPEPYKTLCWDCVKDTDSREVAGTRYWSYWPEMEHVDQLIDLWDKDPYTFESQYMQAPTKLSGGLLDTAWFGRYEILPHLTSRYVYVDTNSGKITDRNDYTVFALCGTGKDGKLYVIDIERGKWTPSELQAKAEELWAKWKPFDHHYPAPLIKMVIEDKQAGQGLITDLKKNSPSGIVVEPKQRGTDQNKVIRHHNCQPRIKAGDVMVPMLYREDGQKVSQVTYWNGDHAASTDWVIPFFSECDALTYEVLMDKEDGYDDQYDTIMDAIDDNLISDVNSGLSWL
ncbi:terminase-like family protein [Vibrio phage 1.054.O._10N.261.52.A1]|nr:terminase-like family protein [Vibrio phage 1.054.O._10N.261.52.A1]